MFFFFVTDYVFGNVFAGFNMYSLPKLPIEPEQNPFDNHSVSSSNSENTSNRAVKDSDLQKMSTQEHTVLNTMSNALTNISDALSSDSGSTCKDDKDKHEALKKKVNEQLVQNRCFFRTNDSKHIFKVLQEHKKTSKKQI